MRATVSANEIGDVVDILIAGDGYFANSPSEKQGGDCRWVRVQWRSAASLSAVFFYIFQLNISTSVGIATTSVLSHSWRCTNSPLSSKSIECSFTMSEDVRRGIQDMQTTQAKSDPLLHATGSSSPMPGELGKVKQNLMNSRVWVLATAVAPCGVGHAYRGRVLCPQSL